MKKGELCRALQQLSDKGLAIQVLVTDCQVDERSSITLTGILQSSVLPRNFEGILAGISVT